MMCLSSLCPSPCPLHVILLLSIALKEFSLPQTLPPPPLTFFLAYSSSKHQSKFLSAMQKEKKNLITGILRSHNAVVSELRKKEKSVA